MSIWNEGPPGALPKVSVYRPDAGTTMVKPPEAGPSFGTVMPDSRKAALLPWESTKVGATYL